MSGFLVAVDYGTENTVGVLRRPDGQVRPLLVDGSPVLPSAACVGPDGRLLVGRDAERAGRVDPAAFVPDPRSRIDAGEVALGRSVFPVVEVIGATLARVAGEAIHSAGGVLPRLVLTHPACWSETRRATLTEAGFRAGLGMPTLVPIPVAAAWYQAGAVGDLGLGRCLLVYHLGAGTFEASLLRRVPEGYELLAADALDDVGGVDLDGLLLTLIGATVPPGAEQTWQRLVAPTTPTELRQFAQLCDDVRAAKETLSRQLTVGVHIPLVERDVHITREAFETAVEPLLARTVDVAADLLTTTGTPVEQLADVLLLGGASRIPLVTTLLKRRIGRVPTACKQPELAVAEGALAAAAPVESSPMPSSPVLSSLVLSSPVLSSPAAAVPVGPAAAVAAGPSGSGLPDDELPTQDLTGLGRLPAATPARAGPGPRRRPTRLLAAAAGLVMLAVLAGAVATLQSGPGLPSGAGPAPTGPAAALTDPATGALASLPTTNGARTGAGPSAAASATSTAPSPAPSGSPSPQATTPGPPPPVQISITVNPTSGTCSSDITFLAHVTVNDPGKYRWRWVFGGPNNYFDPDDHEHDLDKTGNVHTTRKFDLKVAGTYWGQIQITSPVSVVSEPGTVEIACFR